MDNNIGIGVIKYDNVKLISSCIGDNVVIGEDSFVRDSKIGNNCSIERRNMLFNSHLGNYTYTGYNTVIKYATIGKFCSVSWNVSIGGANHDMKHITTHPFPLLPKFGLTDKSKIYKQFTDKKIVIGNDVWIASNACILRGVTIADGAVIGAGAVVNRNVGPYEVWAGVPAKKIGQRFPDSVVERLLNLAWWEFPENVLRQNIDLFNDDLTNDILDRLFNLKVINNDK
ncbi:CatB-related O-acetyltransferase [Ruminococcus bicirculans (ex Wegman et al. 2014)]|jgi:hypothetical protein|uniref:Acetyltransferase n=1 Tax=Ruminococcus bicirculans (ex Wegman et al. 2014) TaxID=1160721 RepID=A0AAW5KKW4_9FIRM|nr:acetyltransferase [Ruminococcus bicirculans (ex Wegman et al. 2014)]MCQ5154090.1 acetyltransferase [Ruminococcus bicirculans (ex Wegman et al. 2014)]